MDVATHNVDVRHYVAMTRKAIMFKFVLCLSCLDTTVNLVEAKHSP